MPNVTSIIGDLTDLSMVPPDVLEVARQKGNAAHKLVELDAKGDLDEAGLPEWMNPILAQWRAFVSQFGFKVIDSEKRVYHPTYRYAGTMDLYGESNIGPVYIDVKRSFMGGRAIGLQIAAYQAADIAGHKDDPHEEKLRRQALRFALRLKEGEPYRMQQYKDPNDFNVFTACLVRHQWKGKQ